MKSNFGEDDFTKEVHDVQKETIIIDRIENEHGLKITRVSAETIKIKIEKSVIKIVAIEPIDGIYEIERKIITALPYIERLVESTILMLLLIEKYII